MQILIYLSNETSIANSYGGWEGETLSSSFTFTKRSLFFCFMEVYSELKHPLHKEGDRWYEPPEGKQKLMSLQEIETRKMLDFSSPVV